MMRVIDTDAAPKAIGPYVQAIAVDGWLYSSGQIPLTPEGELIARGIEEQTEQVFKNLKPCWLTPAHPSTTWSRPPCSYRTSTTSRD